jgi:hypothetical protein
MDSPSVCPAVAYSLEVVKARHPRIRQEEKSMHPLFWVIETLVVGFLAVKMMAGKPRNPVMVASEVSARFLRNSLRSLVHDKMIFTDETATFGPALQLVPSFPSPVQFRSRRWIGDERIVG